MNARSRNLIESRSSHSGRYSAHFAPPLVLAGAIAPLPELSLILQFAALGGAIGGLVAARARRRSPRADASTITSAWAGLGLVVGVVVAFAQLLFG